MSRTRAHLKALRDDVDALQRELRRREQRLLDARTRHLEARRKTEDEEAARVEAEREQEARERYAREDEARAAAVADREAQERAHAAADRAHADRRAKAKAHRQSRLDEAIRQHRDRQTPEETVEEPLSHFVIPAKLVSDPAVRGGTLTLSLTDGVTVTTITVPDYEPMLNPNYGIDTSNFSGFGVNSGKPYYDSDGASKGEAAVFGISQPNNLILAVSQ